MRRVIVLMVLWACVAPGDSQAPAFRLERLRQLGQYPAAAARAVGLAWDRSGAVWSYSVEDLKTHAPRLYRFTLGAPEATAVRLGLTEAGVPARFELVPNLFARADGHVFFPVVWRDAEFGAGIVRVSSDGQVSISRLTPPVMARHLVVRRDGSFVVLGIDGGFFTGREAHCHLLHVYNADGQRLSSFSPCPDHGTTGLISARRHGVDFRLLTQDVDHAQLWVEGDTLFHLLPATREVRAFSSSGLLSRTVRLQAPAGDVPGWVVRKLFPLRDVYLVYWMLRKAASPGTEAGDVVAAPP